MILRINPEKAETTSICFTGLVLPKYSLITGSYLASVSSTVNVNKETLSKQKAVHAI